MEFLLWDSMPVEPVAIQRAMSIDDRPPLQHVGGTLRRLRLARGWTPADLAAQLASVSQAYLSLLEAGQREPALELVLQIAARFNVARHDLLLGDSAGS